MNFVVVQDLGGGMVGDFFFENDINPTTQYNTGVAGLNGNYFTTAANAAAYNSGTATAPAATAAAASDLSKTGAPINASGAQAASTWGNGQVKLGLKTAVGYVAVGAVNNAGLDFNQMSGPFGTALGSGYGATQAAVGGGYSTSAKVRYDNSVRYLTPDLLPGLIGSLTYRAKNTMAANNMFSATTGLQALSGVTEIAAIYRNGPLNLIAVQQSDDANGTKDAAGNLVASAGNYTNKSIGGNYTAGAATLYAGYQAAKNDTTTNNKTTRVGIKYAMSPELTLSAAANRLSNASNQVTTVNGIGADYAFNKQTALYFRHEAVSDGAGRVSPTVAQSTTSYVVSAGTAAIATTDISRSRTMVGLRLTF